MVGASYVPENLWRPAGCYIINQVEDMSAVAHADQPILTDAAKAHALTAPRLISRNFTCRALSLGH